MTTTSDTTAATTSTTGPEAAVGVSAALVAAVSQTWAAIRARHPQVPAVVVTFGSGTLGTTRGQERLGHFAGGRWLPGRAPGAAGGEHAPVAVVEGEALAELFVGGEGLRLGAVELLDTLLHEGRARPGPRPRDRRHLPPRPLPQRPVPQGRRRAGPGGRRGQAVRVDRHHRRGRHPDRLRRAARRAAGPRCRPGAAPRPTPAASSPSARAPVSSRTAPSPAPAAGTTRTRTGARRTGSWPAAPGLVPAARQVRLSEPVLALGPIICGVCEEPFTVDPA